MCVRNVSDFCVCSQLPLSFLCDLISNQERGRLKGHTRFSSRNREEELNLSFVDRTANHDTLVQLILIVPEQDD
ncbi:unnamed protein product [Pleuronectes platessa]|uniref:Uncharacterized protein n=1 Tax=Pleuronectes platessa TaxID=8262 RepID=A0A9N7Y3P0_PLEPL|nr:unnamed protein product [Pleuronectes platessa]